MSLPAPANNGEVYLAAILKELESIRAALQPTFINVTNTTNEHDVDLKEPVPVAPNKRRK